MLSLTYGISLVSVDVDTMVWVQVHNNVIMGQISVKHTETVS